MDFGKVLQQTRDLQATLRKKKAALEKIERRMGEKLSVLNAACRPACIEAIREYNTEAVLRISPDPDCDITTSINTEHGVVNISAELEYPSGSEPDECLDPEDVALIEAALGKTLNEKLATAGIPLTFGRLGLPVHYFGK